MVKFIWIPLCISSFQLISFSFIGIKSIRNEYDGSNQCHNIHLPLFLPFERSLCALCAHLIVMFMSLLQFKLSTKGKRNMMVTKRAKNCLSKKSIKLDPFTLTTKLVASFGVFSCLFSLSFQKYHMKIEYYLLLVKYRPSLKF